MIWGRVGGGGVVSFIKAWLLFHHCAASLFKRRIRFISCDAVFPVNRSLINPLQEALGKARNSGLSQKRSSVSHLMALNFIFLHLRPPPSSVITYVSGIRQVCASARGVLQLQIDNFVHDRTCQYRFSEYRRRTDQTLCFGIYFGTETVSTDLNISWFYAVLPGCCPN